MIFGILIIEDILAIVMIALLSGIAMTGSFQVSGVASTLAKMALFLVATIVIGLLAVPRLVGYVARFKSNEMLLITVLALCFGCSLLAEKLGYSVALGAFIIGAVIAEAREIGRIEVLTEPIRDMFSAIFFVAIGLMIDPAILLEYWLPILVITLVVVIGKVVTCSFGAFVAGNDTRTSLRVGMGLAQIGEFSFIIASLGLTLSVTSRFLYPIAVAVSAITTLLTPYLIKGADGLVNWFAREAPRSLVSYLELYTQWVGQLAGHRHTSMASQWIRKWLWQMGLNAALIAAVFVSVAFIAKQRPVWLRQLKLDEETVYAALWLAAVILTLPLMIATFRKLQALGLLVAELKVSPAAAGERTAAIRAVIAHLIPLAGIIGLGLYVLALSSAVLPPLKVLLLLLLVVGLLTGLLWRSSIKIYARAQVALEQTFAQPPSPRHEPAPAPLPGILREADLDTVSVVAASAAAGKLIRELRLRTVTGASIVGIERNGASLINPGPDEELQAGDRVLILGNRAQLDAARALFEETASPAH